MGAASRPAPEEAGGMYLSYSMNEGFCQTLFVLFGMVWLQYFNTLFECEGNFAEVAVGRHN
jgi:hypothetical protein